MLLGTNTLISVEASAKNTIGGIAAGARNVISGAPNGGILLDSNTGNGSNNVVQGNYIGTDITSNVGLGNGIGIDVAALNTTIEGNVISDSQLLAAIFIAANAGTATGTIIQGNFIGTNAAGTVALPNVREGINDRARDTTIGGDHLWCRERHLGK